MRCRKLADRDTGGGAIEPQQVRQNGRIGETGVETVNRPDEIADQAHGAKTLLECRRPHGRSHQNGRPSPYKIRVG